MIIIELCHQLVIVWINIQEVSYRGGTVGCSETCWGRKEKYGMIGVGVDSF